MKAADAKEGAAILSRSLALLIATPADTSTEEAADLRRAAGALDTVATSEIRAGTIGEALRACFDLAYAAGATLDSLARVRAAVLADAPDITIGATSKADQVARIVIALTSRLSLATEAKVIADTKFTSTADVALVQARMNDAFEEAEVWAADSGEAWSYSALVALRAAVTRDLSARGRLLPRVVTVILARPLPALVIANRLYGDASRADELRLENKATHPLFMPVTIRALSR